MLMKKTKYVDPLIGTVGDEKAESIHGGGKTHPGACYPFGMVQLSPDTMTRGDNGTGYNYCADTIEGFSFNHMSGIGWYGDLGNLQIMPVTGKTDLRSGSNREVPFKKALTAGVRLFLTKTKLPPQDITPYCSTDTEFSAKPLFLTIRDSSASPIRNARTAESSSTFPAESPDVPIASTLKSTAIIFTEPSSAITNTADSAEDGGKLIIRSFSVLKFPNRSETPAFLNTKN